jgi:hypothetical protein
LNKTVDKNMLDMEVVDELLHYIPEIPEDNYLEISQFVLLPSDNVESSQYLTESDNNNEFEKSENSEGKSYPISADNKEKDAEENPAAQKYKAKRGRPPSKPPTREVVRKCRKVS